jgi:hypothetical protein
MHRVLYQLEPGAILGAVLIIVISLGFLVNAVMRGRHIPACFQCGAVKVRPSPPIGFVDAVCSVLMIRPYRCLGCRARFHAVSLSSRSIP